MEKRFGSARTALGAWALPLGAVLFGAAAVAGCPGPDPQLMATSGSGGSSASAGGTTRDTGSAGTDVTTSTAKGGAGGGGGDTRDGGQGGSGCMNGLTPCNGHCVDLQTSSANCGVCGRACSLGGSNHVLDGTTTVCSQATCKPKCQPGFIDDNALQEPNPDDGCETPTRRVFVTSAARPALFGPTAGAPTADAICASVATAAGLTTMLGWRAWFSPSSSGAPKFVFDTQFQGAYVWVDGLTIVARTWGGLTSGSLVHAIGEDENGNMPSNAFDVWTGTAPDGSATGNNCIGWTSPDQTNQATVGLTSSTGHSWTQATLAPCNAQRHLYCFEDPS